MSESRRLNWKVILQHNPELNMLAEEEQLNINHPECPAGRDNKRRLYIRKRDGGLIGFCHHCQSKGGKSGRRNYIAGRQAVQTSWQLTLPKDYTQDLHVAAVAWLNKYGITKAEVKQFGIGWSEESGRVILPIYQGGVLVAYQSRRVFDYDKGPKYLTDKAAGHRFPMFLGTNTGSDTVVLCEDILSAIKVNRAGVCGVALLGVNLSEENVHKLVKLEFTKFVIWLDDDNHEVKRQQRKICKRLDNFGETFKVTGLGKDPKELSDADIDTVLQR